MDRNKYSEGALNVGAVQSGRKVSAPAYMKIIRRMVDLSVTNPGTEISVGAADVQVFADFPVDLTVGQGATGSRFRQVMQCRLTGWVDRIRVRKTWANAFGRVVVYAGTPALGIGFSREDPRYVGRLVVNPTLPEVWLNASGDTHAGTALPMPLTLPNLPNEAYYLFGFHAWRDGGTIEEVRYIESETGASLPLWMHSEKNVTDRVSMRVSDPVRLPSAGAFQFIGNAAGADTDLYYHYEFALI